MKNNYSVAIIEDNVACAECLRHSLAEYTEFAITAEARDALNGKKIILEKRPDLLFLDVELPDSSGVDLLRQVKEFIYWPMHVIFYTAYEKYLLTALRESAFDYLLKPYDPEEFQQIISRYLTHSGTEVELNRIADTLTSIAPLNRTFLVTTLTGYQCFKAEQIGCFFFDKQQKQWNIIASDQTQTPLKRTTRATDILQYSSSFVQISQHQIINIEYLYAISDKICRMLPPFDKLNELHVSRIYLRELQNKINQI